jgi:DnaJ-class molecular chaperone
MGKSYFAVLGVTAAATLDEIRSAYRRLAKEYHPDHYPGGKDLFLQIQEAYSVLGDAYKRHEYEKSLQTSAPREARWVRREVEPEPLIPKRHPVDLGEISLVRSFQTFTPSVDEIFDWLWNNFSTLEGRKSGRLQNLTLEVPLSSEEAMRGGNARVMVPARAVCPICLGRGGIGYYECARCAGEGAISGEVPISLSFPAGLRQNCAVVIPLERFGIQNLQLTVLFRLTEESC